MIATTTAEDLRRIWDACDRAERQLAKDLEDVRAEKAACALLLTRHAPADGAVSSATSEHAHIRLSSLAHCTTQMEAFKEIARQSAGIVRLTEACRLVHAAGLSSGKVSSIVSSMPRKFLERGEWEWVDAGIYRLLDFAGTSQNVAQDSEERVDADECHVSPDAADAA